MNNLGDITTIKLCGNKEIYNNILLWFRGNKVTLGYPNMQDIVSKAINNTSADERVQMQKIINKMFEPVFFQKYNNTISWNQFVPKELKQAIAFRNFSINYSLTYTLNP